MGTEFHAVAQTTNTHTVTISEQRIAEILSRGDVETALEQILEVGIHRWSPSAMSMRAMTQLRRARFQNAEMTIKQLISSNPKDPMGYKMLGDCNYLQCRYTEAELCYGRAASMAPSPETIHDLGVAIVSQWRVEECLPHFREASRLAPEKAEFKHHLAIMLVLGGHLEEGWEMMKHRIDYPGTVSTFPNPEKYWDGGDLTGKTICVRSEQGWGDTIMFARYLPALFEKGAKKVYFWCQRQMVEFVRHFYPEVIPWPNDVPPPIDWDCHMSIMCFPRFFPGQFFTEKANPEPSGTGVGICWFGSPTHKADHLRSVQIERFEKVAQIAGGKLKCLGYGRFEKKPEWMEYYIDHCWNWKESADQMEKLDLVITVDTAVAHLAGFIGKECWLLLPYVPDFRWGMTGERTVWYDSVKLYRQPSLHDWDSVFARVENDLRDRFSALPPSRATGDATEFPLPPGGAPVFSSSTLPAEYQNDPTLPELFKDADKLKQSIEAKLGQPVGEVQYGPLGQLLHEGAAKFLEDEHPAFFKRLQDHKFGS